MYSEKILEHFKSLEYAGEMKNPDAVGQVGNIRCGDVMKVFLKIKDGVVVDIKFLTYGCIAAIASSEAMCRIVKGKKIEEALKITAKDIVKELGGELPPVKIHCSVLGREALGKAIENYREKVKKN
ncbi:iron-sulfur cluster assembly scaffold protein [Candidatus Woesearchaeota archaeon]|nr:iron-sulfur cluster assembly scaffold protein [Candidatus Woesearchaeota archaeon]